MASSKPSKQRKRFFQAPKHKQRKMLSARLSDDLTARHKVRRIPLRTGDTVRIMRGEFADLVGKVEKAAGISSKLPIHSSKVLITNLNLSDKWRSGLLSEKSKMVES